MTDITIDIELLSQSFDNALKRSVKQAENFSSAITKSSKKSTKQLTLFQKASDQVGNSLSAIGINPATIGFTALAGTVFKSVNAFRELEIAQVGLQKTTNFNNSEINKLTEEFKNLSEEIPVSTNELLDLGKVAGQLGISGSANILKFSETIARLASASDVVGEQGASSIARILNITKEATSTVDQFASALVDLGNNSAATESEILGVANEVARSTAAFNLSSSTILGLSSTLKSLGTQAQLGGSVVGKSFRVIEKALNSGGRSLQKLSDITGIAGDDLKQTFQTDANAVFISFLQGVSRLNKGGQTIASTLASFGLSGDEVNKVLPTLVKNIDQVTGSLQRSENAYNENTALLKESEAAYKTLDARIEKVSNTITNFLSRFGKDLVAGTFAIADMASELLGLGDALSEDTLQTQAITKVSDEIQVLERIISNLRADTGSDFFGLRASKIEQDTEVLKGLKNELIVLQGLQNAGNLGQAFVGPTRPEAAFVGPENNDQRTTQATALEQQLTEISRRGSEQRLLIEEENSLRFKEIANDLTETELQRLQDIELRKLELKFQAKEQELAQKEAGDSKEIALEELLVQKRLETRKLEDKLIAESEKKRFKTADKNNKEQQKKEQAASKARTNLKFAEAQAGLNILSSSIQLAQTLSSSNNRTLFFAAKAAALAQIAISTAVAVARAPAEAGPIAGIPLATLIAANGAIQAAVVVAQTAKGFEQGGIVPGTSFTGDNVTARVNSGEMILNNGQQRELFNMANGGGNNSDMVSAITKLGDRIQNMEIVLEANDTELAKSVSRGVQEGVVIGVSR